MGVRLAIVVTVITLFVAAATLLYPRKAVWVVNPPASLSAPLKNVTIEFSNLYVPGTFRAVLDGEIDLTNQLGSVPAAGRRAVLWFPDPAGFAGGCIHHKLSVPAGTGKSAERPAMEHTLTLSGTCKYFGCDETSEWKFIPVHLAAAPNLGVRVGASDLIDVSVHSSTVPIDIWIQPIGKSISMGDANAGKVAPPGEAVMRTMRPGMDELVAINGVSQVDSTLIQLSSFGVQQGFVAIQVCAPDVGRCPAPVPTPATRSKSCAR